MCMHALEDELHFQWNSGLRGQIEHEGGRPTLNQYSVHPCVSGCLFESVCV